MTMTALVRFSMRKGGTLLVDLKVMRQLPERPTVLFTGMMMAASLHLRHKTRTLMSASNMVQCAT
jgi:hypothetical protein